MSNLEQGLSNGFFKKILWPKIYYECKTVWKQNIINSNNDTTLKLV
jgi:hypothetical protein